MPRKATFPPRIQNAKGYARVFVDGKYVYLGVYGSDEAKRAYADLVQRLTQERELVQSATHGDATVATICAGWLTAHPDMPKKEKCHYTKAIRVTIRTCGKILAEKFDVACLEKVRLAMLTGSWMNDTEKKQYQEEKRPLDWSRDVTIRQIIRVRSIWRWAERNNLVPCGSASLLQTIPDLHPQTGRKTEPRQPCSYDDVEKVAQYAADPVAAMMKLSWWSGMRPGEVRIMRTCDIDQTTGPMVDGVRIWLYRPTQHKNKWRGQQRIIPLGVECQKLLTPWLNPDRPEAWIFQPPRLRHPRALPFYTEYTYCQSVRRAATVAKVSLTAYQLRHAAKRRITQEMGLDAARAILGQESILTTDGYAQGTDLELAARAARRLG